jgi:signal transduction histidine kinase/ActR/RegA family two-component response regulator
MTKGQDMIYNRVTLAFPGRDEILFKETYFADSLKQFRLSFAFVIALYGAFAFLDTQVIPEYAQLFHFIRFFFVIPLLVIVLLLSFTKSFKNSWQFLVLLSTVAGGSGIAIMTMLAPENYTYYAGMMLVFSAGYFFIRLRFFYATIAGWLILLIYNAGAIFYTDTPAWLLITNNFFFISANLIGMFAAYNIEYYARRNFSLNQKLDTEKLRVEEINRNLEEIVNERTKELVKAKEKAQESDRLKSAFLANMSHEIRTPMNGILGFAQLIKHVRLNDDERNEYIEIIENSGARMLNIINDIMDISKIEAGLITTKITNTDVNSQIKYIHSFFIPESIEKGISLSYNNTLPDSEAFIETDSEKLYAILANLVKNAIKFCEAGSIALGYEKKGGKLEFFVRDTGIGIPANRLEAIFERFVQADLEDKRASQGAGLGLSIAKAYIDILGGEIWVESMEGVGTTFYFTLPYINGNISDIQINTGGKVTTKNLKQIPQNKKIKVLIAEDDEVSEQLLKIILHDWCSQILIAGTGKEAIEAFSQQPDIDLIFMDLQMPEMSGLEATRQIRKINKSVIIIAQTAFGMSGDREKAIAAGCNDYISKPLKNDDVIALVVKYFNINFKYD